MVRKKINKRLKPRSKAKTDTNTNSNKLVKSFHQIALKLIALFDKEAASFKKKQNKLKNIIDKNNIQIKKTEKRLISLENAKGSNGKNQQRIAKKKLNEIVKSHQQLNKQWEKLDSSLEDAVKKHTKFIAINKQLDLFEKEWPKQLKTLQSSTKINRKKGSTQNKDNEISLSNTNESVMNEQNESSHREKEIADTIA